MIWEESLLRSDIADINSYKYFPYKRTNSGQYQRLHPMWPTYFCFGTEDKGTSLNWRQVCGSVPITKPHGLVNVKFHFTQCNPLYFGNAHESSDSIQATTMGESPDTSH